MPSRKQRRRRQKERRHEYEYIYVDEQGQQVAVEEPEPAAPARNGARPETAAGARGRRDGRASKAPNRKIDPPSWRRVGKRTLIFAPLMFVTIALLDRNLGVLGQLVLTLQMLLLFIPFSYLMDRLLYRRYVRQTGASGPAEPSRRRS